MPTVTFTCEKDRLVEQYHANMFGGEFQNRVNRLASTINDPDTLQQVISGEVADLVVKMTREARYQEHYDFEVDDDGWRQPVRDVDGKPRYLVPVVGVGDL